MRAGSVDAGASAAPNGGSSGMRQLAASVPFRTAASGTQIAIPILAVDRTGDIGLGAMLVALALIPSIVAAPLVGAVLDRARRPRRLLMGAAAVSAVTYAIAAALDPLPVWAVASALVLSGLLTPFGFGGLSSFVAADTGAGAHRAYALDALSYNVSGVAGPMIVAVLAPTLGPRWALVAMAVIALASVAAYPLLRMQPRDVHHDGLLPAMAAGLTALVTRRRLALVVTSGALAELGRGILPIAALSIALRELGDAAASAAIVAAFAIGALVGAAVEPIRPRRLSPQATMAIGFAATGVLTLGASLGIGFAWTVALVALSGLCTAAPTASMLVLRRSESPDGVVAQVFTVGAALRTTASAAGTAVAGALAGADPLVLLAMSGAIWVVAGATMLGFGRGGRRVIDEPPPLTGPAMTTPPVA